MQDLIIVVTDQCQLESVFSGIDWDAFGLSVSIKTVYHLAFDSSEIDRLIKSFDDPIVSVRSNMVSGNIYPIHVNDWEIAPTLVVEHI